MAVVVNLLPLRNATAREQEIFQLAARNVERAINHPDFGPRILSAKYDDILFKPKDRPPYEVSPQFLLDRIMGGLERDTTSDFELDMEVLVDHAIRGRVLGSTVTGQLPWRTARWFVEACAHGQGDTVTSARHLLHEWLHVAGFIHVANDGPRVDGPYVAGNIARGLILTPGFVPGAWEDAEVRTEFEAAMEEVRDGDLTN